MQQPEDIERQLAAVQEHVEQCRAALAIPREGDAARCRTWRLRST